MTFYNNKLNILFIYMPSTILHNMYTTCTAFALRNCKQ